MKQQLITMEMLNQVREILNRIYDTVRIVSPCRKKLLEYPQGLAMSESGSQCHEIWGNKGICDNCVSMRACAKQEVFSKLECKGDAIYMVTAVPVQSDDDIVVLELLKDVSSSILVNESRPGGKKISEILANINQMQVRDGLTGLFNRGYLDERLPADIINSSNSNTPLSIILSDIDHFKRVNDTYGHIAGDHVLKQFAQILEACMKGNKGWVSRYGGEEFLIALSGSSLEDADKLAEDIRKRVENEKIFYNNMEIRVTASFGVTTLSSGIKTTPEELINIADRHLYMAKNSGRNKVISGI